MITAKPNLVMFGKGMGFKVEPLPGAKDDSAVRLAVFILEDALSVWTNLGKHSLFV